MIKLSSLLNAEERKILLELAEGGGDLFRGSTSEEMASLNRLHQLRLIDIVCGTPSFYSVSEIGLNLLTAILK